MHEKCVSLHQLCKQISSPRDDLKLSTFFLMSNDMNHFDPQLSTLYVNFEISAESQVNIIFADVLWNYIKHNSSFFCFSFLCSSTPTKFIPIMTSRLLLRTLTHDLIFLRNICRFTSRLVFQNIFLLPVPRVSIFFFAYDSETQDVFVSFWRTLCIKSFSDVNVSRSQLFNDVKQWRSVCPNHQDIFVLARSFMAKI